MPLKVRKSKVDSPNDDTGKLHGEEFLKEELLLIRSFHRTFKNISLDF